MNKTLLIVDDSRFIFEEMKHILKETNFEIVGYAKSGEEAIELYEKLKPDIMTLDIIMPGMDGFETANIILKKWPDANIIIVSSLAYDETIERADSMGIKSFIFKPFDKDQILDILENIE